MSVEPVEQEGQMGAEAEITCPVYSVPGTQIGWSRQNGQLPPGSVEDGNMLKIPNFQKEYVGTYECKVQAASAIAFGYISVVLEGERERERGLRL